MEDVRIGALLVLASAVGFGTLGIFGVVAGDAGLSIPTVLFFRFALATVGVWTVLGVRGELQRLRGRNLTVAVALGAGGYATMSGLYFVGLEFMTAGMVAIVLYTYPAFVLVLAATFLDEPVGARSLTALALTLGGVALITGVDPAAADPRGVIIVLGAAAVFATYITVSRTTLEDVSPPTLTAHVLPAAGVMFLVVGVATGSLAVPAGTLAWSAVLGIAVLATAFPIFAFFAGLSRIDAGPAAILSSIEPVVTVVLGAAVLGEPVSAVVAAGGAMVVAGVAVVPRR